MANNGKVERYGASTEEHMKYVQYLANLETVRVNQFVPFTKWLKQTSGSDTTSEKLRFEKFEPGWIYVVTSITAMDITDAAHQIRIGVTDGSTDLVVESSTVANAGDSVEFVGQLMLKETDGVYVEFRSIGASDEIWVVMNGYKIRR